MKLTKDDKNMLAVEYAKAFGDKRAASYASTASGFIEIDGTLIVADKPHIKTTFWFGEHGYDYDEVTKTCNRASEDEQYFIDENIRWFKLNNWVEWIDNGARVPCLNRRAYYCQSDDCKLGYIDFRRLSEIDEAEARPLTDDETAALRRFCIEEVEKFQKRLQTYLKRYGLSKCRFSTYWADR